MPLTLPATTAEMVCAGRWWPDGVHSPPIKTFKYFYRCISCDVEWYDFLQKSHCWVCGLQRKKTY